MAKDGPMSAQANLEQSLDAYEYVISQFGYNPVIRPGRIKLLGWDLEYVCGPALANFIDQILIRRFNDFIPDNDHPVILDCGANIGFSVLHYKRMFPQAKVVAFEPDPQFSPLLRRNLACNGASDVEVVEAAAWIQEGEARWLCEGIDGSRIVAAGQAAPNTVIVRTVDLANYLSGTVDLLKLDIEGAEYAVLDHMGDRLQKVKNIVIECHVDQSNVAQFGKMLGVLSAAGFQVSVNTFGPWRDLIRQEPVAPNHWEQYLLVAGWRNLIPQVVSEYPLLPYSGAQPSLELRMLRTKARDLGQELHKAQIRMDILRARISSSAERENHLTSLLLAFLASGGDALQTRRLSAPYIKDGNRCWYTEIPDLESIADDDQNPVRSTLLLFENEIALDLPHSLHEEIRNQGGGHYSHWKTNLYFSTSDDSDPNTNGRKYGVLYVNEGAGKPCRAELQEILEAREHSLDQLDAALGERQKELDKLQAEIADRQTAMNQLQAHLQQHKSRLDEREARLDDQEADLLQRELTLKDRVQRYEALLLVRIGSSLRRIIGK